MIAPVILDKEPDVFQAGDSLYFHRWIPEFPSNAGWTLQYELLTVDGAVKIPLGAGGLSATALNGGFLIQIDNFGAALEPGEYILAGYIFSPAGADPLGGTSRQAIYREPLLLTPNMGADVAAPTQKTYAQQQVESLQTVALALNQSYLLETDLNRVRILREKRDDVRAQLNYWEERRANELNIENIRNGGPDRTNIRPFFRVFGW